MRRTLDYYACKMFSTRQEKGESVDSWGSRIDEMQTDLREAARRACKEEGIKGAVGLVNYLGKACFIQGLHNERIQTVVRSPSSYFKPSKSRSKNPPYSPCG